ncbi:excinuclease ABC subunit UvrC [Gilvimarinus agarilyticus]|uniref:excinuclease ABC subunit UvrC n=1 Tax=unclassified Gilvimarinus TaxID=2642066 RepID=UPI001C08B04A|nr:MULTISPECIES: excinuclease ABC subunit UvrC [unclassified Gilvimarinus]MBU2887418.1 excinuclease ABC subunit UvrC [Gilvimarinus agarilyticus]MDO6572077.1 excinuclease ABC subunit UvrC [Gilvimarinus sp. 2_MG-2023]MDO6746138.1 excinuclease ABC subunit UvrC [Gilvimarinus sp. 1_MG-2023]
MVDAHFDPKQFLSHQTQAPGVYQMFNAEGDILYVGKAKNLKKRLASYFRATGLAPKTQSLVARIARVEVTITTSESEALILEQNLIKSNRPPYNILLRDDKSYPYVFMSSAEPYPRIALHRGAKKKTGDYYGPYPNVSAVRDSLGFLQKTFKVRQCEDSVFRNRSRPCLQYQIDRCTGPCVDLITPQDYAQDVHHTRLFLQGKNQQLLQELANEMDAASEQLAFERAAQLRDQISALRTVQAQQSVEEGTGDMDIVAVALKSGNACVHVLFIRQGRILGSRSYYPKLGLGETDADVLGEFLPPFYLSAGREVPAAVVTSAPLEDAELLSQALATARGAKVMITHKVRSYRAKWVDMAQKAAEQNIIARINSRKTVTERLLALQDVLGLDEIPARMECFDISHSSGELTVASCVVFDKEGPAKSDYRRFNIDGITGGDDYAAMEQALTRRYTRLQKGEGKLPDILFIDGGKGQMGVAERVLGELGVSGVQLVGVAKGTTRKPGFETLYNAQTGQEIVLGSDSPALHIIQQIRDEAHRFAITGHKNRRDKKRRGSTLDDIPGVGPAKRRELLRHFGGLQELQKASITDLAKTKGISRTLAEEIYGFFHSV